LDLLVSQDFEKFRVDLFLQFLKVFQRKKDICWKLYVRREEKNNPGKLVKNFRVPTILHVFGI